MALDLPLSGNGTQPTTRRGRPSRFAHYDAFLASLPRPMAKRPKYLNGVGVFRGHRDDTAWVKVHLTHGGVYQGTSYRPNASIEIKVGRLASWSWEQLEAKRTELQGKADRGEPLEESPPIIFADWARQWLERARHRLRSYPIVRIHVECHLIPALGDQQLTGITVSQVNDWLARKLADQAPATVHRELATLSVIMNDAVRSGVITSNPCRLADPIRGIVGRQRFLEGEELIRLLAAAAEVAEWLPDLILWCLHSGMRKGEVKALCWDDIRSLPDGRVVALVRTSKADRPRTVPCTRTMVEVLQRQQSRLQQGDPRVFPVASMTLRRKWEKARERAGLRSVNLHDLRRTHSTHAAAAGVDLRTLADRIGHADLTMLQRHYAAVVGSAATEAADTFQAVFDRMVGVGRYGRTGRA